MKKLSIAIILVLVFVAALSLKSRNPAETRNTVTPEQRKESASSSLQQSDSPGNWPATPEELIADFWNAASRKDYPRMVLLCPGSVTADFQKYYDQWTPLASRKITPLPADPQHPGVNYYQVHVPFPGFPNKTVKMAIRNLTEGRPAIDGRNTIWW